MTCGASRDLYRIYTDLETSRCDIVNLLESLNYLEERESPHLSGIGKVVLLCEEVLLWVMDTQSEIIDKIEAIDKEASA
ncbi:MAG: hypothetical protein AB7E75_03435 [Candidatus Methanomethylophilaceae archaeon]